MTVGLLSLPLELLRRVVDQIGTTSRKDNEYYSRYCARNFWVSHSKETKNIVLNRRRLKTICDLRLVNRRLHDAASHALASTLKIQLSNASLDRTEKLISIPQVAFGIHTVQVSAAFYHGLLAHSVETFVIYKREKFDAWEAKYREGRESEEDSSVLETRGLRHLKMSQIKLLALTLAFDEVEHGVDVVKSSCPTYRAMIEQAFERFGSQREEQQQLIQTGQFVTRLAYLLTKLPQLKRLYIQDTVDDLLEPERTRAVAALPYSETIIDRLAEPRDWRSYSDNIVVVDSMVEDDVAAAALLCDIPIALHRAGVQLRHLHVCCLPDETHYKFFEPLNCFLKGSSTELGKAFSSGMKVHLALDSSTRSTICVRNKYYRHAVDYAMLCSASVCTHDLKFDPKSLLVIASEIVDDVFDLQDVLIDMEVTRLDSIDTPAAAASSTETKSIVNKTGPRTVVIFLSKVYLCNAHSKAIIATVLSSTSSRLAKKTCLLELRPRYGEKRAYILQYIANATSHFSLTDSLRDIMRMENEQNIV